MTPRTLLFASLLTGSALSLGACGREAGTVAPADLGETQLSLVLPGGAGLDTVAYTLTATGFSRTGTLDVSHSATISAVLSLPAGGPYDIALSGLAGGGQASCEGAATFSVTARTTTTVPVHLTCHETPRTGSALITGTLNICPQIDGISASPIEIPVGASASLAALAHDTDGMPSALSYAWTANAGTFSNAAVANPVFTCTAVGAATLTLTVSDGDTAQGCAASQSVAITCAKSTATYALFGDWPYGTIIDTAPAFITQVNADPDVELALHVGDIHAGSQPCSDAYNQKIYGFFQSFSDPLVYTPGDNEWTDCQKTKEMSSGAPLDELAKLRRLFFAHPGATLGASPKAVLSQANVFDPSHPEDAAYVENVLWQQANVLFVTLNVPGSNDDRLPWAAPFSDPAAQADEIARRDAANSRWLARAFATAASSRNAAVLIALQADMWDPSAFAAGGDGLSGYDELVKQIATLSVAFGKPVLLVNGDSHLYEADQPLADPTSATGLMHPVGFAVPNLTRLTVDGSTNFHDWVKLTVDPATPAVFSWSRITTP